MICDSHAHLNHGESFAEDRAEVLRRAREAGVSAILNVATTPDDAGPTVDLARAEPDVHAAVGIHPHEAERATDTALDALEELAADPKVRAWGEIGLDYHYMHASPEAQRSAFTRQLERAARLGLPVSVHSRDAEDDTINLLRRHAGRRRGVLHCFTGSADMARRCLDLGFLLSFSGIVTFRNADVLREVARTVPEAALLVETDSPYLAPAPRRGGRNEPARVRDVLALLADIRRRPEPELAAAIMGNYRRLLDL